jgi:preprotein translocase subunit SecE
MSNDNDSRESKPPVDEAIDEGQSSIVEPGGDEAIERVEAEERAAGELGAVRYVHAAFFVAGMLAAYVCGKLLLTFWNAVADVPAVVRVVPQLIQYGEDERGGFTLVAGAILGALIVLHYYRKPSTRTWADEVAAELSRVTWPTRETVMNGTLVVLIAGAVGTVYVTLLDRFWGYLTNLVYGA